MCGTTSVLLNTLLQEWIASPGKVMWCTLQVEIVSGYYQLLCCSTENSIPDRRIAFPLFISFEASHGTHQGHHFENPHCWPATWAIGQIAGVSKIVLHLHHSSLCSRTLSSHLQYLMPSYCYTVRNRGSKRDLQCTMGSFKPKCTLFEGHLSWHGSWYSTKSWSQCCASNPLCKLPFRFFKMHALHAGQFKRFTSIH